MPYEGQKEKDEFRRLVLSHLAIVHMNMSITVISFEYMMQVMNAVGAYLASLPREVEYEMIKKELEVLKQKASETFETLQKAMNEA